MAQPAALILQLSDLHMLSGAEDEDAIADGLVAAIAVEAGRRRSKPGLLCVTGDVFDSSAVAEERAIAAFTGLQARIHRALGHELPTVIVPGNHDRRRAGLLAPFKRSLFEHLRAALGGRTIVHGTEVPFLADVVPHEQHGLPLWLIAYDSTYLPSGWVSAGGILRQADLLQAAAEMGSAHPEWPVMLLLHHHLVPTPITDMAKVETDSQSRVLRWGLEHVLPYLIPNADHEEMAMAALGAGTALSTLHAMGRPVIVLHGHKHYATARMLSGVAADQGDVMIISAGSAGLAQSYTPGTTRHAARLWPSFNAIELDDDLVQADVVSFGYRDDSRGQVLVRPLVRARRDGAHWRIIPFGEGDHRGAGPQLSHNELRCTLLPSDNPSRWHLDCQRSYGGDGDDTPSEFMDTIDALEDGELAVLDDAGRELGMRRHTPTDLRLVRGQALRFRIENGVCRTISESTRLFGARWSPYSWMGIMNRYASDRVRIEIVNETSRGLARAFASATDLSNGMERPLALAPESSPHRAVLYCTDCPARTLLRVHWPLEASAR
jgi:3',5'-cyclic AMP phosphodiesterase CpdA